jgi:hypothetical protein
VTKKDMGGILVIFEQIMIFEVSVRCWNREIVYGKIGNLVERRRIDSRRE